MCNRQLLAGYLKNQLEEDDRLEFLFHLDTCPSCWDEVYMATKASHPHYYKRKGRKVKLTEKELGNVEKRANQTEEVFEVA